MVLLGNVMLDEGLHLLDQQMSMLMVLLPMLFGCKLVNSTFRGGLKLLASSRALPSHTIESSACTALAYGHKSYKARKSLFLEVECVMVVCVKLHDISNPCTLDVFTAPFISWRALL